MNRTVYVVGSLDALRSALDEHALALEHRELDVTVVPTAAAFSGVAQASVLVANACLGLDARVEGLMVSDRASANEPYFAERIARCDIVVLCDGSALHARTVWRSTPVGDALKAARLLVAIGSIATVLGEVMIDPRGGAPTTGLGLFAGVAFCAPSSEEQLARTRTLLGIESALVVVGPRAVVRLHDGQWRVLDGDDVVVTRGHDIITL